MRRLHLLTPTGCHILTSMLDGYALHLDDVFGWYLAPPPGGRRERLNALAVLRLLDAGYVERAEKGYRITDMGRKALEAAER